MDWAHKYCNAINFVSYRVQMSAPISGAAVKLAESRELLIMSFLKSWSQVSSQRNAAYYYIKLWSPHLSAV